MLGSLLAHMIELNPGCSGSTLGLKTEARWVFPRYEIVIVFPGLVSQTAAALVEQ